MTLEEAITNIENVCRAFNGNLDQHTAIQQSLAMIKDNLKKDAERV